MRQTPGDITEVGVAAGGGRADVARAVIGPPADDEVAVATDIASLAPHANAIAREEDATAPSRETHRGQC